MNQEFEQLLEDQWEGRLTAAGRARLAAMAAADPALARRLAEETNLSGMLAGCGPNRAPRDLAAGVFARLAEPEEVAAAQHAATPPQADDEPRKSIWSFFQIPALRWGMGFALAMFLLIEVGILLKMNDDPVTGTLTAMSDSTETRIASVPEAPRQSETNIPSPSAPAVAPEAASTSERDVIVAQNSSVRERQERNAAPVPQAPDAQRARAADESPDGKAAVPVPTATPNAPQTSTDVELAAAKPVETPAPAPPPSREAQMAAAEPVKTPEPAPAPSAAIADTPAAAEPVPTPAPTPRPEAREIRVAMQIALPDGASSAAGSPSAASIDMPGTAFRAAQGSGMRVPAEDAARILRNGFSGASPVTPGAPAADLSATEAPLPTRKDIEIALASVGARFEAEPANETATLWRINTTLTEHQLGDFLHAVHAQNLTVAEPQEVQPSPSPGSDAKGKGLSRFDNLANAGIKVQRKGAAAVDHFPPVTPRQDVLPGQYAVLEGEPLVRELNAPEQTGPVKLNSMSAKPRTVHLTLLIQEPAQ